MIMPVMVKAITIAISGATPVLIMTIKVNAMISIGAATLIRMTDIDQRLLRLALAGDRISMGSRWTLQTQESF